MAHLNRKIGIPSFDMTGKTAIITGGTQGLGFGMACALAAYGANVVITARTASKVEDAVADLNENYCKGGRAFGIPADSSKLENVKMVIDKTVEEFGSLDILINNAGISGPTALVVENREGRKEYTPEDFSKVLATNLTGTFMFCQEAARQMIKQNQRQEGRQDHHHRLRGRLHRRQGRGGLRRVQGRLPVPGPHPGQQLRPGEHHR